MTLYNTVIEMSSNLGMSFENIILFVMVLGCLLFFAKSFKLGFTLLFLLSAALFVWFYDQGMNYTPSVIVMFMSLIFLALSFFAVDKAGETGGFV